MMLNAFKYAFEDNLDLVLKNFLLALEAVAKEEPMDVLVYYGYIYLRYIELTHEDVTEEDIRKQIEKLDGKGAVTMSILERRELLGIERGKREGRLESTLEIAKNLLKAGAEIALITKATGLSKSKVEDLKEELKNK